MKRSIALMVATALVLCGCAADTPNDTVTTSATETNVTVVTTEVGNDVVTTNTAKTEGTLNSTAATKTTGVITQKTTTVKTTAKTETNNPNTVTLTEPANGYFVEAQSDMVEEYMSITDEKKAAEFWVASYSGFAQAASFTARWESKGMLWRVYVSEDPTFKDVEGILTTTKWMRITNLMPGRTYYWKVVNGFGEESEVRSVTVEKTQVRWIEAPDSDNIRDMGGWKTESGKTVKYELLYRGGCLDGYNGGPKLNGEGIKVLRDQLGIRTEIDLRGSDSVSTTSPFGVTYVNAPITQYDYIYNSSTTKTAIGTIFKTMSKEENYPILFHCNAGADRTGTLAFLVNGLLGVSQQDLTRDFELTGFSKRGKRLRAKLEMDTLTFSEDGVMQYGGSNYIAWGPLHDTMMKKYGTGSGKLSDAIANFLKTECGVTQSEIDSIRRIMLK